MAQQSDLKKYLQTLIGKRLDSLNLACEMMMFRFQEYALHVQCLSRVVYENDILVTTLDYQSWDGEDECNNDEWYFTELYRAQIVGGVVVSVDVTPLNDVVIALDNGIRIELFVKNGYHHFDEEHEQWMFFKCHDHSYPFITVYSKTVDIALEW